MKNIKKAVSFLCVFVFLLQMVFVASVSAASVKISKFTKMPEEPKSNQAILFRVRTEGEVEKVYISIDKEKDIPFERKSNNIWELEKKLTDVGTRYLKVTAVGVNGDKDSLSDTIDIAERNSSSASEKNTAETTTKKVYTGNAETSAEEESSETTTYSIVGGEDFDGGDYTGDSLVDDSYFELSLSEDMAELDEISYSSVFMFVNESTFVNKWKIQPIDDSNPEVKSYIKDGYTLVPLRAVSEAFNADVSWDANTRLAEISYMGKVIKVTPNSYTMNINGRDVSLDVSAEINNGRLFVPLRAVAEGLDKNVYYKDKFIGITNNSKTLTDGGLELIRQAVLRIS